MVTPYGPGADAGWNGIVSGHSAIKGNCKFSREVFITQNAAMIPGPSGTERSRLMDIVAPALESIRPRVPEDAALLLATTTGEIDLLERAVIGGLPELLEQAHPRNLLNMVKKRLGIRGPAEVISAACASSAAALARAADMVSTGRNRAVLVAGCDALSEFVFAGFSTLMALSPTRARPFDCRRDGLSLGEAAAFALVMEPERAYAEKRDINARIMGWASASDANHMTGPSREGEGLAETIKKALRMAGLTSRDITSICAHGTGTVYNDAMEMKAFNSVLGNVPAPLYSIKGSTGHTMGAAGVLEALIAAESIKKDTIPPTVGAEEPHADAAGRVSDQCREIKDNHTVLTTNSGFGGANSAIILGATQ